MDSQINEMYLKRLAIMEIKKMVSDRTILKHGVNLRKLHNHITSGQAENVGDLDWVNEPFEFIKDKVESMPGRKSQTLGMSAQQSYYFSILVAIRARNFKDYETVPLYAEIWNYIQGDFGKDLSKYKKSKDNVSLPDYDKVKELINDYQGHGDQLDLKLILKIYETYPFRLEVAELVFIPTMRAFNALKTKEGNFLVKSRNKYLFSFNNYKTGDTYGERRINITNKDLTLLLKDKTKEMVSGQELFPGLTRNNLSMKITNFFKERDLPDMSPTVMAKLIIQEAYRNMGPELKETQERLAKERGHSIQTQLEIYLIE